jgi:hypothetical protein
MKQIIKFYGLPRSGTNLIHHLLALNFTNYVCNIGEHGVHYLGWKHGKPINFEVLETIEKATDEQALFVFTQREFKDWYKSVSTKHIGTYEFIPRFWNYKEKFIYNTPTGPEIYNSAKEFYDTYIESYKQFCIDHPERSILIHFEDLQKNQKEFIDTIKSKFNLELTCPHIIEIKKQIDSRGKFEDVFTKKISV